MAKFWEDTFAYLEKCKKIDYRRILNEIGQEGVEALSLATPIQTGRLASSWSYKIENDASGYNIVWHNNDIEGGYNVALLVQLGHGTGRGVYVSGTDYINPALEPIVASLVERVWKEVLT